jgi:hypothetical protein
MEVFMKIINADIISFVNIINAKVLNSVSLSVRANLALQRNKRSFNDLYESIVEMEKDLKEDVVIKEYVGKREALKKSCVKDDGTSDESMLKLELDSLEQKYKENIEKFNKKVSDFNSLLLEEADVKVYKFSVSDLEETSKIPVEVFDILYKFVEDEEN